MLGSVARRPRVSPWRRLTLIGALVFGGAVVAQAVDVRTFTSVDVPVIIPEVANPVGSQAGDTRSVLQVNGIVGSITEVTVSVYITHEYTSDLAIRLIPPNPATGAAGVGNGILLADNIVSTVVDGAGPNGGVGTSGDNAYGGATTGFGSANLAAPNGRVVFADAASGGVAINPANPAHVNNVMFRVYLRSGTYQPLTPLATFAGLSGLAVNGTWTLLVEDQAGQDQGYLRYWSMTITAPGQHTWTGAGADTNWSTAENWLDDNVPSDLERNALIVFPDDAVNRVATKDDLPGGGTLTIQTLLVAEGYSLDGTALTMATPSTIETTAGSGVNAGAAVAVTAPLQLLGATTLAVGDGMTMNLDGAITNAGGVIATGGALTKNGTGTVALGAANGYTGVTTISAGVVSIDDPLSLGTAAGGTVVVDGATLLATAGITVAAEPLTLGGSGTTGEGSLAADAAVVWNGPLTMAPGSVVGIGANGFPVTLSNFAAATGLRSLAALGTGTVTLTGALPTGAVTDLSVNGGTLTTTTVAQPNVGNLSITGGTVNPTTAITISGSIGVGASAAGSTLAAGTINLGGGTRGLGVVNGAAVNDLTVNATFTNGGLSLTKSGTVLWNSTSTGVAVNLRAGVLMGSGTVGNLTVGTAKLAPTGGGFTVANCTLGSNSWLAYTGPTITASGTVAINGGVLQPFSNGTVINGTSANTGAFRFYPRGGVVDYDTGFDVVVGLGGGSVSFAASPYAAKEGDPPEPLSLTSGGVTVAITTAGGELTAGGDFMEIASVLINGVGVIVPLTINDDFIDEGTETGELIIIPLSGGVLGGTGNATLTITDNDKSDTKSCGFGTGLTVFLLLGFGLLLHVRLRRL